MSAPECSRAEIRRASSTTSATGATPGRGWAAPQIVRALAWHSLRSAFGFGRGAKAKIFPALLFVLMCLPAVINAVAMARGRRPAAGPLRHLPVDAPDAGACSSSWRSQAPELVSRDLRNHTLPLYFSRPIARGDYPLAKLVAFTGLPGC